MPKHFLLVPLLAAYLRKELAVIRSNIEEAVQPPSPWKRSIVARRIALLIGIGVGFVQFGLGFQALFVLSNRNTWVDAVTVLAMTFALLPLSIFGLFRARIAAYCLFLNVASVLARCAYMLAIGSIAFVDLSVIVHLVPQLIVGSLLLYSAGSPLGAYATQYLPEQNANSQRTVARWAAVSLGGIAGALSLKLGSGWLLKLGQNGGWLDAILITTASFALLPISIVGFWRPRIASYLLFGAVALTVLGASYTLGFPVSFYAGFHLLFLIASVTLLPLTVGGLLLYSSTSPTADH